MIFEPTKHLNEERPPMVETRDLTNQALGEPVNSQRAEILGEIQHLTELCEETRLGRTTFISAQIPVWEAEIKKLQEKLAKSGAA